MMNRALLDVLGYTKEEIAWADYLGTFVPEEDRQGLARVFHRLSLEAKLQSMKTGSETNLARHILLNGIAGLCTKKVRLVFLWE